MQYGIFVWDGSNQGWYDAVRAVKVYGPTCPKHPHVTLTCAACIGAQGGQATSAKKTRANRRNATRKRPRAQSSASPSLKR